MNPCWNMHCVIIDTCPPGQAIMLVLYMNLSVTTLFERIWNLKRILIHINGSNPPFQTPLWPDTSLSMLTTLFFSISNFEVWFCDDNLAASWQNKQYGCAPSKDSDQPGHPPSLIKVFAVLMKKPWVLSYPMSAQRRLWSDWADAGHTHILLVLHVAAQLWKTKCHILFKPGTVARSEASSLGMQAALSSIPMSGTFFRGDLVMKTFLWPFSLFRWFKKSSCQLLAKECALSTGKLPRRLAREQCG